MVHDDLYDEYPVKLEIYAHKSVKFSGLWDRFVKSLGPNTWVEFELTKQYRAVPCSGGLRFKTESDRTFFLLRFS
jgi:hypothetical protein